MIFKPYRIIFLTLVCGSFSYDLGDLSTLGQRISNNVHRQLVPLQNLGSRISLSVQQSMESMRNGKLYKSLYNPHVSQRLQGLNNLGQQIEQNVYQELEPVRALDIIAKMKGGVGGVTIATYLPEGKQFLIRYHQHFTCNGPLSDTTGICDGTLTPFKFESKKDYCYNLNGYSIVNNHICIGANSVSVVNNVVKCESFSGTPAVVMTVEEYNKMCQGSDTVEYKYLANAQDPMHVDIPNSNKYVKCSNHEVGLCVFSESRALPQNSNVFVNNVATGFTQSTSFYSN